MPKKSKSKTENEYSSVAVEILTRFSVVLLINTAVIMSLCLFFYLTDKNIYDGYAIILIIMLAADFITSYYVGRHIKKNGMIYGIAYNLPIIILFVLISLIMNNFSFDSRAIVLFVSRTVISAIGGIIAVNSKSSRK